jgi:uncharacterized ion transporter superfamily protein YfcC
VAVGTFNGFYPSKLWIFVSCFSSLVSHFAVVVVMFEAKKIRNERENSCHQTTNNQQKNKHHEAKNIDRQFGFQNNQ